LQRSHHLGLDGRLELDPDRSNREWLTALAEKGPAQERALAELRGIVRRGLPYALSKWLSPSDPHFDALADEVTQETLLRVLDHLPSFEGRSKFTTWVHKIAVRVALTELRRKRWRDVSLHELVDQMDDPTHSALMISHQVGPEATTEQNDLMRIIQRLIAEELTDKQRQAIIAVRLQGMPIEEVAHQMGMKRNALYKLLHDARLRLKRRLENEGLSVEDILAAFESG
jgi:RNA polymerase sigma-70 factor (ECF subfamily)